MRRPPWLGLIGIALLAVLPGCAGFQQREWFGTPSTGEDQPRAASPGLFSWWRSPRPASTPPEQAAETNRVENQAPPERYESVWPEPRSTGLFRFFPWSRRQPADASTHRLMSPFQENDAAETESPVHMSSRSRRPKAHGLPEPAGDVELDVNARQASADESASEPSSVQSAAMGDDSLLPRDLSASSVNSSLPASVPDHSAPVVRAVDAAPRLASTGHAGDALPPGRGVVAVPGPSGESEPVTPPALLTDEELSAQPAPEPTLAQTTGQAPAKPATPPAPPVTKPAVPPPPPVTNTKPLAPPAPPAMNPQPAAPPAPPVTSAKPLAPTGPPPSIAPDEPPQTTANKPAPKPAEEPISAPPPAPAVPTAAPPPAAPAVPPAAPAQPPTAASTPTASL